MDEMITQKGLELDVLSPGDIVTAIDRNPKFITTAIYRVMTANTACAVVVRLNGPEWIRKREIKQMNQFRWFEASELLEAMNDA